MGEKSTMVAYYTAILIHKNKEFMPLLPQNLKGALIAPVTRLSKTAICALGLLSLNGHAATLKQASTEPNSSDKSIRAAVPFLFSSEDWGLTYGAAGVMSGVGQPQMTLFGTFLGSSKDNYLGYVGLYNMMIPGWDQVQFDLNILEADYKSSTYFLPGNPDYPDESAGSRDSSYDNSVKTAAREQHYQLRMRYTLPVGAGRDGALMASARKSRGYQNAGYEWNPEDSGITTLELQPFYQSQRLEQYQPEHDADSVAGVRFIFEYDNRNSTSLPTRGNVTTLTYTKDWGSDDRPSWATMEFEFSQFLDLGSNSYMNQQVLALNGWIADTPTWNDTTTVQGQARYHRPPSYAGVTLGGWDKLRGYSTDRFHGRSAVSYTLEYRVMPKWQPMEDMPVLGPLYDIPWWQWALFLDMGQISDRFSLSELHKDMKASAGLGVRFKVEGVTVRADMASGSESLFWRIFINQPF